MLNYNGQVKGSPRSPDHTIYSRFQTNLHTKDSQHNLDSPDTLALPYNLPWTRTDSLSISLILLSVAVAVWRFWQPGIPNTGDMLMSVYRVFELVKAWGYGILYPRLGPDLMFGYTAPLFQFYPPLVSYLAALLHSLGLPFIAAVKATLTLNLLLSGVGMYLYARRLLGNRCAAWVSAIVYALGPYFLLNVYERGAAAESLALMLLPWLVWALHMAVATSSQTARWWAAGLVAAVMLAHNITALWAFPAVTLYVIALSLPKAGWQALRTVAVTFGLGLALSAFYWLPALLELGYTHTAAYMLQGTTDVTRNLVAWRELIQLTWFFAYQGSLRFRFSLLLAVLGALGVLGIPLHQPKLRRALGWLALLGGAALCLQLDSTLWFWQHVPLVRYIQLPWRLYGLATFAIALLTGALFAWPRRPAPWLWAPALLFCALLIGANCQNLAPALLPLWHNIDEAGINEVDLFTRGVEGYPLFNDYSPAGMQTTAQALAFPRPATATALPPLTAMPTLNVLAEDPQFVQLAVQATAPFPVRVSRIFLPGWQVAVNGQAVPTYASGLFGLVTADLPAGEYTATVRFGPTLLRRGADWLSLLSLSFWLASWPGSFKRRPSWLVRSGIALAILLVGAALPYLPRSANQPVAYPVNFQNEIHLLGYALPTTSWPAGGEIRLRLYWLAQQTPTTDYKIFLHLTTLDDQQKVAQADSTPMLGFTAMSHWEAGELVIDEHRLQLEPATPPGHYRLLIGLYRSDAMQNLRVDSAPTVLPGDRVLLTELDVVHE